MSYICFLNLEIEKYREISYKMRLRSGVFLPDCYEPTPAVLSTESEPTEDAVVDKLAAIIVKTI